MSAAILSFPSYRKGAAPAPVRRQDCLVTDAAPNSPANPSLMQSVFRFAPLAHIGLAALAAATIPALYLTLETPKWIVNGAIGGGELPSFLGGLAQKELLVTLVVAQLVAMLALAGLKFASNLLSANLGERFLRQQRQIVLRHWRSQPKDQRDAGVAPVLTQELEAIAGFAGGAVSVPVVQAGAFLTVMAFLLIQDWRLAIAAIALTPVQAFVVPLLLRRISELKRERIATVKAMCARLTNDDHDAVGFALMDARRAQDLRFDIHRRKFAMKAIYNVIGHLTPISYLSVGGWLVLSGDLSAGALVAAIAAYREGAGPLRELFNYYLRWTDARTRYAALDQSLAPASAQAPASGQASGQTPADAPQAAA